MRVVVIGGGVIGYSVAHELAAQGVGVDVIDMRGPGCGATQASAGMLAPYIEGHDERLLRLGVHSLSLYDAFVAQVAAEADEPIEYCRSGSLQVATSVAHADALSRAAAGLQSRGVAHSLLTGHQVRALEPDLVPEILCGLTIPTHGYVRVSQLMSALTHACARLGVVSVTDHVTGVEPVAGGVRVMTESRVLEATAVVIAAGSWSGQLAIRGSANVPVHPVRGQSLELIFDTPPLSRILWSEDCYLVPWKNGSVIVGATVEDVGFDEASTPEGVQFLLERARRVLPTVASARLAEIRVGLRPATSDELPLIGWCSSVPGVCLATGHYRNGILLAPLTARLVAEIVLRTRNSIPDWVQDALAPSRMGL